MSNLREKTILILSFEMPPYTIGGIGTVAYETTLAFKEKGYKVLIIAPNSKTKRTLDPNYYSIPVKNNFLKTLIMFIKALRITIKNKNILIYSLSGTYCGFVSLVISKLFKINYYVVAHGIEFIRFKDNFILRKIIKKIYNNSNKVFSVSKFTKKNLIDFGVNEKNIFVCYNGVNIKSFYKISEKEKSDFRKLNNIDSKKFCLLTISRLDRRKAHLNVLKALDEIFNKEPNLKKHIFYIIGGKGEMFNILKSFIKEKSLEDNVSLLGFVKEENINKYYNICDLFIHPNIYIEKDNNVEGFGIVFLEAAAAGKASIGGEAGGSSEAITNNETGLVINGENIDSIKQSILSLYYNKNKLDILSNNAFKNAVENFNWNKITDKILEQINYN